MEEGQRDVIARQFPLFPHSVVEGNYNMIHGRLRCTAPCTAFRHGRLGSTAGRIPSRHCRLSSTAGRIP